MKALNQLRQFHFGCLAPAVSARLISYILLGDDNRNNDNDNNNDEEGEDYDKNNDDGNYDDDVNSSDSGFPFFLALHRVDMDLERSHYLLKFE